MRIRAIRGVGLLLMAVMVLLAACGPQAPESSDPGPSVSEPGSEPGTQEPSGGGTLTVAMRSATTPEPDPNRNATISSYAASELVAQPLVRWEDEEYVGILARDWETSEDGTQWTLYLREGVLFHSGRTLDAQAVKATVDHIKNPDDPLPAAGALANVTQVEVVDDLTVRFHLETLNPEFLLTLARVYIVDSETLVDEAPAGTGPFRVTENIPDQHLILDRFDDYWEGPAELEQVIMRAIPDGDTLVLELEAGTVDLTLFVPSRDVLRLQQAGFEAVPFVRVNTARLAFNLSSVTDVRLREATCWAIDRDVVIQNAYAGFGTPQYTIAVQGSWAYNDELEPFTYDPDRARAVLDEAGWLDTDGDGVREMNGEPIDLHFPSRGDDQDWLSATQIIQQMIGDVGIGSHITTAERLTYYDNVRLGDYDLTWWISNAQPEPPIYATLFHSTEHWNITQFASPELDALIDNARSTLDQGERAQYYRELQAIHRSEVMECNVMWIQQLHVASPALENLKVDPTGVVYNGSRWRLR